MGDTCLVVYYIIQVNLSLNGSLTSDDIEQVEQVQRAPTSQVIYWSMNLTNFTISLYNCVIQLGHRIC